MLKKNDTVTAVITGYDSQGLGVARVDGQVVFVHGGIRDEACDLRILKVLKNAAFARVERVITPSPHRVTPDCPHYRRCGGCAFRHMDYEEELWCKRQRVQDALTRIGGWDGVLEDILPAPAVDGYRNKSLHPVSSRGAVGFFRARSHDVEDVADCRLLTAQANAAAAGLREYLRRYNVPCYDETTHTGLVRHLFTRTNAQGQCLICVIVNGDSLPREEELVACLRDAVPPCVGVVLGGNTRPGNAVLGDAFRTLWGSDTLTDTLCGMEFTLSVPSFYQVNRAQAETLYETAAAYAAVKNDETVLDLYCGAGTITSVLARRALRAIGAEIVPQAVENARKNAVRNGLANVEFLLGDAADMAEKCAREGLRPDVISVDPPRKGLEETVIDAIEEMAPLRIVYVSCDPATLGRDVKRLAEKGYTVRRATAVDMFPRTAHVETVCLLRRKCRDDGEYMQKRDLDEIMADHYDTPWEG